MKIPVFTFKQSPHQFGDGNYLLVACFVKLGIHVPFSIYCHSENEYLNSVGRPKKCNEECCWATGHMEDFGKKRSDTSYTVKKIIEAANNFKKRKRNE
jgi:hypothetical protein